MVTLSEAFRLCQIGHGDSIEFVLPGGAPHPLHIRTGDQIRRKVDMTRIHVHRIKPWFSLEGDYCGWQFTVDQLPQTRKETDT